jgi:hypothetical protein
MAPLDNDEKAKRGHLNVNESVFGESQAGGGWGEYRRLILSELERISGSLVGLNEKIDNKLVAEVAKIKVDIGMLQVKSGIWGAVAAIVTTLGIALLTYVSGHFK